MLDNKLTVDRIVKEFIKSQPLELSPEYADNNTVYKQKGSPTYIHPELKEIEPYSLHKPIFIFSAPGAVGKTTFAKYLSHHKSSYYWDLSKIRLGDNTFVGTIATYFGYDQLGEILKKLSEGKISFFFDGFDEAEMTSGSDGILTFVKDIYDVVKKSPFPVVMFFSRTETVEWIKLILDDLQSSKKAYSLYEIDFFNYEGATEFIKYLFKEQKDNSYLNHKSTFKDALDSIFFKIGQGLKVSREDLWINKKSKSFIGYSPVLQTIARYLMNNNFQEVINNLNNDSYLKGVNLIQNFAKQLLNREQQKLVDAIKNMLEVPDNFSWENVYTPNIQLMCLFSYITKGIDSVSNFIEGPEWLKPSYLSAVKSFLQNHPFIRNNSFANTSFKDYTLASLAENTSVKDQVISYLESNNSSISVLFAFYYYYMHNQEITPQYIGFVYESILSGLQLNSDSMIQICHVGDSIDLTISYQDGLDNYHKLAFNCSDNISAVTFYRKLYNADIVLKNPVCLNGSNSSFELNNVNIQTSTLIVDARILILKTYDESPIVIISDSLDNRNSQIRIDKKGTKGVPQFYFSETGTYNYPWNSYSDQSLGKVELSEDIIAQKIYALRLILQPFRKHKKGVFGKQHEYIENVIVKNNEIRRGVFNQMIKSNILKKQSNSPIYELDEEVLEKYGINWGDLNALRSNEKLNKFFT